MDRRQGSRSRKAVISNVFFIIGSIGENVSRQVSELSFEAADGAGDVGSCEGAADADDGLPLKEYDQVGDGTSVGGTGAIGLVHSPSLLVFF